jgi:preprotein translocase subunit SecB
MIAANHNKKTKQKPEALSFLFSCHRNGGGIFDWRIYISAKHCALAKEWKVLTCLQIKCGKILFPFYIQLLITTKAVMQTVPF